MLTPLENIALKDLMKDLEQFQTTTILLQDAKRNLQEVRSMFDELLNTTPRWIITYLRMAKLFIHPILKMRLSN